MGGRGSASGIGAKINANGIGAKINANSSKVAKKQKNTTYKVGSAVESIEKQLGVKLAKSTIGKEKRNTFSFDGIVSKSGKVESFSRSGLEENVTLATIQSMAKKSGKYRIEKNGAGRYAVIVNKTKR